MIRKNYNSKLRVAPKRKLNENINQREVRVAIEDALENYGSYTDVEIDDVEYELKIELPDLDTVEAAYYDTIEYDRGSNPGDTVSFNCEMLIVLSSFGNGEASLSIDLEFEFELPDIDVDTDVYMGNYTTFTKGDIEASGDDSTQIKRMRDLMTAISTNLDMKKVIKQVHAELKLSKLFVVNESRKPSASKFYTVKLTESHVRVKNRFGRVILDVTGLRARSLFRESRGNATRLVKRFIN